MAVTRRCVVIAAVAGAPVLTHEAVVAADVTCTYTVVVGGVADITGAGA